VNEKKVMSGIVRPKDGGKKKEMEKKNV